MLTRSFLMKFCINRNQIQILSWPASIFHIYFVLLKLAFFCVLCKGGFHFEVNWTYVYKKFSVSEKEYEFGFWVRNVIIVKLGDGIMQQHTEVAKKIKDVRLDSIFNFFPMQVISKHSVQMLNNENANFTIFVF